MSQHAAPTILGIFAVQEVHGRFAYEAGDKEIGGVAKYLSGCADLIDEPLVHHGDAVRQGHGLFLIMGYIDHGVAELNVKALEIGPHVSPLSRVEVRDRLIQQEDTGFARERPGNSHQLLLTTAQLLRLAIKELGDPRDIGNPSAAWRPGIRTDRGYSNCYH